MSWCSDSADLSASGGGSTQDPLYVPREAEEETDSDGVFTQKSGDQFALVQTTQAMLNRFNFFSKHVLSGYKHVIAVHRMRDLVF